MPLPRQPRPVWLVILTVSLPMFMATLDNLVVTSALPVIRADLDASIEELAWVVNAYTLAFASGILMASAIADRFGRRRLFALGLVVFTAASALCGMSGDPTALIAARALQGLGGAFVMPLSLALLSSAVPDRLRPAAIGIWGGVAGLGVALGPLIGGLVVEGMTWQAIFWLNVPLGAICLPLILVVLDESRGRVQPFDVPGVLLAAGGVLAVTFGIVRGNDAGWTSLEILGSLLGGVVLLLGFLAREARTPAPLLPLRLFRHRSFAAANVVALVFSFGIFGAIFILIQFLQVVQHLSPLEAGVRTMPWTLAPLVVAPLTGLLTPRIGVRPVIVTGLVLQSLALAWIAAVLEPEVGYGTLVPAFVLAGIGMGLVLAPIADATLQDVAPADQATASGTNSTAREIGVALGVATLTAVFEAHGGVLSPTGFTEGAVPATVVGSLALALAAVCAGWLPRRRRGVAAEVPAHEAVPSA